METGGGHAARLDAELGFTDGALQATIGWASEQAEIRGSIPRRSVDGNGWR
jgi:hypothetical protein